jgi:hypothetical protein
MFDSVTTFFAEEGMAMSDRKIGAGHAQAMFRLGLKELRNAANPSRESVADSEIGLYATQTQGEIAEARGGPGQGLEQESSRTMSLDELRKESEKRQRDDDRGDDHRQERGGMDR